MNRTLVLEYWLPLLVWLGLTYYFSTDSFSAGETSKFIIPFLKFINPAFSADQLDLLHTFIRKLGHISEYFVLGALTYRALKYDQPDFVRALVLSLEFIVLAGMTDEFHQAFTMSRGPSIIDVAYDSFGGVLALWGAALLQK